MNFYSDLKIKGKLFLGFSTVVLLALAIGIFGYFQIQAMSRANEFLIEKGIKPMEHIGDISATFQRLRVNLREFILANALSQNLHYEERVKKLREEIDDSCKKLETTLPDAEAKKLFARLMECRRKFTPI